MTMMQSGYRLVRIAQVVPAALAPTTNSRGRSRHRLRSTKFKWLGLHKASDNVQNRFVSVLLLLFLPIYVLFLVKDAPSGVLEPKITAKTRRTRRTTRTGQRTRGTRRTREPGEPENQGNQRNTKIREPEEQKVLRILLYFIFIQMCCDVSREVLTPRMIHVFRRRKHIDLNRQQGYSLLLLTKQNRKSIFSLFDSETLS